MKSNAKKVIVAVLVILIVTITLLFYLKPYPIIKDISNYNVRIVEYNSQFPTGFTRKIIEDFNEYELLNYLSGCRIKRTLQPNSPTSLENQKLTIMLSKDGKAAEYIIIGEKNIVLSNPNSSQGCMIENAEEVSAFLLAFFKIRN